MIELTHPNRRYLAIFLAVFIGFVALNLWFVSRLASFHDHPINFSALTDDNLVITLGLTRRQSASMKIGFIENFPPPKIGLFGNHSFQYFNRDAFGERGKQGFYFFNFWYTNLALPELTYYIEYLERIGKLPTETLLVQITAPNNDNGMHILNYNGELPSDMIRMGDEETWVDFAAKFRHYYEDWDTSLRQNLNYAAFIFGLFRASPEGRILRKSSCDEQADINNTQNYYKFIPLTLRNVLLPNDSTKYCDRTYWWYGLRPDGTHDAAYAHSNLVLDANPLSDSRRALRHGDDDDIARWMRRIADVGKRSGRTVVFIIPPVYESERPSIVNDIMTHALKRVPDLNVIDHRDIPEKRNASFYISYDHPGSAYFEFLVNDLVTHGYMK